MSCTIPSSGLLLGSFNKLERVAHVPYIGGWSGVPFPLENFVLTGYHFLSLETEDESSGQPVEEVRRSLAGWKKLIARRIIVCQTRKILVSVKSRDTSGRSPPPSGNAKPVCASAPLSLDCSVPRLTANRYPVIELAVVVIRYLLNYSTTFSASALILFRVLWYFDFFMLRYITVYHVITIEYIWRVLQSVGQFNIYYFQKLIFIGTLFLINLYKLSQVHHLYACCDDLSRTKPGYCQHAINSSTSSN